MNIKKIKNKIISIIRKNNMKYVFINIEKLNQDEFDELQAKMSEIFKLPTCDITDIRHIFDKLDGKISESSLNELKEFQTTIDSNSISKRLLKKLEETKGKEYFISIDLDEFKDLSELNHFIKYANSQYIGIHTKIENNTVTINIFDVVTCNIKDYIFNNISGKEKIKYAN